MFYLTTYSTHFEGRYKQCFKKNAIRQNNTILKDISKELLNREETRCRLFMDYSFQLEARVLLYAPSHKTG